MIIMIIIIILLMHIKFYIYVYFFKNKKYISIYNKFDTPFGTYIHLLEEYRFLLFPNFAVSDR
eukprot:UN09147